MEFSDGREKFIASGESRETSPELMEAIWQLAEEAAPPVSDVTAEKMAEEIWETGYVGGDGSGWSRQRLIEILGDCDLESLVWGADGNSWSKERVAS